MIEREENIGGIKVCAYVLYDKQRERTETSSFLFVFFIALVIRSLLLQRARIAGLLKKNSIEDILLEMSKLRAVSIGGTWRLTEVTKRQRTILDKMGIGVPIDPKKT